MSFVNFRLRKVILTVIFLFAGTFASGEEKYFSWDFSDCDLKDIIYAVSLDSGISIVADDTVSGKGDLKFAGNDFSVAFEAFLKGNRLFASMSDEVWTVSKFSAVRENGEFLVDAYDMTAAQILEKIAVSFDQEITFDSLPVQKMSVHFRNRTVEDLMNGLARRFGGCEVRSVSEGFHFGKKTEGRKDDVSFGSAEFVCNEDGSVRIEIRDYKFGNALDELFGACFGSEEVSYCLLANGDSKITRTSFTGKTFSSALETLCMQNGYNCVFEDSVYYIFQDNAAKNQLVTKHREWKKISLNFTKPQEFIALAGRRIGKLEMIALPDETSVLCLLSEDEFEDVKELLKLADIKKSTYLVNLKYIRPKDFLEHLPPDFDRASFFLADDDTSVFFKGTEASYTNLCQLLEVTDQRAKRISYDLLILQYDETRQNSLGMGVNAGRIALGDRNNIAAQLGTVMALNMNVLSAFGLNFAMELQAAMEENSTRVFADTTLHGVSGKQINFKNTNTYRYRDNNLDPETGKPVYSGITKEITSGIKLDILGWVSGDGTITSTVTASVSRQGTDTSAFTGNPPPTSEKIVTTEVCGKSGQPVVLSGLIQNSNGETKKGAPWISKIPLIGNLFKTKSKNEEKSQMVIYLVPHIEGEADTYGETSVSYDLEWAKNRVRGLLGE